MVTWQERIKDLRSTGLSLAEIARRINMPPSTMGDIATGRTREPVGMAAVRLYQLHLGRCRSKRRSALN